MVRRYILTLRERNLIQKKRKLTQDERGHLSQLRGRIRSYLPDLKRDLKLMEALVR